MERKGATHSFREHTGEVRLELSAPTCEALFAEAGRALAELLLGELHDSPQVGPAQRVVLRARDRAALLVEWINELIFLSEIAKRVFTEFEVERVEEMRLEASVAGIAPVAIKTAVKAATLHEIAVERGEDGWRATVVLDV